MPLLLTSLGFRGGHSQSLEQSPRKHPGHLPPEIQSTPFLGECKTLIPKAWPSELTVGLKKGYRFCRRVSTAQLEVLGEILQKHS